jgi:hypothetical protein
MRLVILEIPGLPQGANQTYEFGLKPENGRVLVVGRQLDNDIQLVDSSVSRHHVEIRVQPDGILVRDLGSSNGTFINDGRLVPNTDALVRPGDRLRIGNVVTLLEGGSAADYFNQQTQVNIPASSRPMYPNPAAISAVPPAAPAPPAAPVRRTNAVPAMQAQQRPVQAAPIPAAAPVPTAARRTAPPPPAPAKTRRGFSPVVYMLMGIGAGLLIVGVVGAILFFTVFSGLPSSQLPSTVFSSPAIVDRPFGLEVSRPSAWQKLDGGGNQILYYPANQATTVLNVEKPPSRTLTDGTLSPERAIRQYLANVKQSAKTYRVVSEPGSVKLKDGTAAVMSKLVFSTGQAPVVTDYSMLAISFRCGNQLYFVSAAVESANYSPAVQQDLDAAIANLMCAR